MRHFGVLSAIAFYIVLFILTILLSAPLFVNSGSFVINMAALVAVCISFYLFAMPYYKAKPGFTMAIYFCSTIAVLHFSCSTLADLAERQRTPEMLPKDDWSGLFIAPVVFVIGILWGWIFDWRKNKATKSQTGNE